MDFKLTEEQKKRFIPPIAKAEVVYCQGWSEPNAGSDLASLTTQAIKNIEAKCYFRHDLKIEK